MTDDVWASWSRINRLALHESPTHKLLNFVIIILRSTGDSDAGDAAELRNGDFAEHQPNLGREHLVFTSGCFMLTRRGLATNAMSRVKSMKVGCGLYAYIFSIEDVWWLSTIGTAHRHRMNVSLSCMSSVRISPRLLQRLHRTPSSSLKRIDWCSHLFRAINKRAIHGVLSLRFRHAGQYAQWLVCDGTKGNGEWRGQRLHTQGVR